MEPTRECSLASTTSVRLTPSAPGGHCSASAVPISKTTMAHAAMVLRMIPFKPCLGRARCSSMQHNRPLGVSAESLSPHRLLRLRPAAKQGNRLICSAALDGVHGNQDLPWTERIAHLCTADCCIHPPGRNEMIAITPPKIFSKEVGQNRPPLHPAGMGEQCRWHIERDSQDGRLWNIRAFPPQSALMPA